jgi:hypothetical protein
VAEAVEQQAPEGPWPGSWLAAVPPVLAMGLTLPGLPPVAALPAGDAGAGGTWDAVARVAWLLPLGSRTLREGIASALLLGCALWLLHRTISESLHGRELPPQAAAPLSVATCWTVAGCGALFTHAALPAALPLALAAATLAEVTTLLSRWPALSLPALRRGALSLGLLLVCAPALALAVAVPALVAAYRALETHGRSRLNVLPFVFALPLAVFWPGHGPAHPDATGWLTWSPVGPALVLAGAVAGGLLSLGRRRRLPMAWLAAGVLAALLGWAVGALDAGLRLAVCAAGVLYATGLAALLHDRDARLSLLTTVAMAALGVVLLRAAAVERAPQAPVTGDALEQQELEALPPRAVLLLSDATEARSSRAAELRGLRPDVVRVGRALLSNPEQVGALARREPTLRPLLRAHLIEGQLSTFALQSLSGVRAVRVERPAYPDAQLDAHLLPSGPFHAVQSSAVTAADVAAAAQAQGDAFEALQGQVALTGLSAAARELLSARLAADARYFLRRGEASGAREALQRATLVSGEGSIGRALEALAAAEAQAEADGRSVADEELARIAEMI